LAHEGTVNAVAFSRDGNTALTASAGGVNSAAARLWDVPAEAAFGKPLVQDGNLLELAISPDGRWLLTGATDGAARLWDVTSGRLIREVVRAEEGRVSALAFSPNGRSFLTASEDRHKANVVRLWDRPRLRVRRQFRRANRASCAAFSPDGRVVAIGTNDGTVEFRDPANGKNLGSPLGALGPVGSVAFSSNGGMIAAGALYGARVWDWRTRRLVWEQPNSAGLAMVAFYPKRTRALVVTGGFGQDWDAAERRIIGPPRFHNAGGMERLAFTADGTQILISGADRVARLWDVATGETIGPAVGRDGARPVAISADGHWLAAGGRNGRVAVWAAHQPVRGRVERVRLWVEVLTGMELGQNGVVRNLDAKTLEQRRQQLRQLGGQPDRSGGP
jgi:WD40 repeat protein